MKKVLICSAVESELSELRMLESKKIYLETLGIGLVESAINLTKILSGKTDIETVVFVGTAGAYPGSGLIINDVVQGEYSELFSMPLLKGEAYFPGLMEFKISLDTFSELKKAKVASVLDINKSSVNTGLVYEKTGLMIEHMELFSVARVAREFSKSVYSVFAVSNIVDESAHTDWKKNHLSCSLLAQQRLKELLLNTLLE